MPAKTSRSDAPSRRRLTAEEARARILEAAERRLAEVGPEGLRLTELAAELGVSHPAILHHFGSREGLVVAVVARAVGKLGEQLQEEIARRPQRLEILDMIAEFFGERGNARLIAWLVLSGRLGKLPEEPTGEPFLLKLIEQSHERRKAAQADREPDFEDTRFRSQLTALALMGESIFGDLIRFASGDRTGAAKSKDFRRRLAKLLNDTM
ncbi:MAG: helix-turn-helix domain containing protein [Myxococcales bacterium]|nr:helix-turn-helix domain containing protein [Myxococcales bacterium]